MSDKSEQEAAARCLEDPEYAAEILAGHEFPALREAIAEDLFGVQEEVTAFGVTVAPWKQYTKGDHQAYNQKGFDPGFGDWMSMPRTNTMRVAGY